VRIPTLNRAKNKLLFALTFKPEFFLGFRFFNYWIKIKPRSSPLLFSERYGPAVYRFPGFYVSTRKDD